MECPPFAFRILPVSVHGTHRFEIGVPVLLVQKEKGDFERFSFRVGDSVFHSYGFDSFSEFRVDLQIIEIGRNESRPFVLDVDF